MKIILFLLMILVSEPVSAFSNTDGGDGMKRVMNITVNGHALTARMEDNSSVDALFEMLKKGPVVLEMEDYAHMEKVGDLEVSLPRNDRMLDAGSGDVILYLGKSLAIYYDRNSWSLTPMGKIEGISQKELKSLLGPGGVIATLSVGE